MTELRDPIANLIIKSPLFVGQMGAARFLADQIVEAIQHVDTAQPLNEPRVHAFESMPRSMDEPSDRPGIWSKEAIHARVTAGAEPDTEPSEPPALTALRQWWVGQASEEIEPMLAKMTEYGGMGRAIDLSEIGRGLVHSGVKAPKFTTASEEEAWYQELGIYFYLLGKFARWTAAIAEGRRVSDDTLHDISVYVRMAQRVRHSGGWPV